METAYAKVPYRARNIRKVPGLVYPDSLYSTAVFFGNRNGNNFKTVNKKYKGKIISYDEVVK
jgi:hypothetical protein